MKPIRAALGRAAIRLACSTEEWDRCASSTITRIDSDSFIGSVIRLMPSFSSAERSPIFWIITITNPGPGGLTSSSTSLTVRATLTASPANWAVF